MRSPLDQILWAEPQSRGTGLSSDSSGQDGVTELCKGRKEHEIIILSDDEVETDRESCAPSQSHSCAKGGFQKPLYCEIEKTIQADKKSHNSLSNHKPSTRVHKPSTVCKSGDDFLLNFILDN